MRKNLELLRVRHDLTQAEMAKRLGVSRTTYCKIENGKSGGSLAFWLKVKQEFPEIEIDEMAKVQEMQKDEDKA